MKVINRGDNLVVLTNRFQRVMNNTLDLNETNFRICSIDMKQIRKDTNCFASCNYTYYINDKHHGHRHDEKPWNHKPWCDKSWYGESWYGKPWEDKHDNNDKYNKDNNHDKNDKDDKHDKYDKYGKKLF